MEILQDGTATLTAEEVKEYQQMLVDAETVISRLEELETKLEETELALEDAQKEEELPTVELSEEVRKLLDEKDQELRELRRKAVRQEVESVLAKAQNYRDSDGRGHSKVLLELARAAMLGEPYGEGEEVIQLSDRTSTTSVAAYNRSLWEKLLQVLPGQVKLESAKEETEEDVQVNPYQLGDKFTKEELASWWNE